MTNQAMTSSEHTLPLCFPETNPPTQLGMLFHPQPTTLENEVPCTFDNYEGADTKQLSFPVRLFQMLQDSEQKNFDFIVAWLPDGTGFKVLRRKQFAKQMLAQYFNGIKYTSFLRQLNLYGFKRIAFGTPGSERGGFRHHQFIRSRPELCFEMHRTDGKRFKRATGKATDKFTDDTTRDVSNRSPSPHTNPNKPVRNTLNQERFWNSSSMDTTFSIDHDQHHNQVSSPPMIQRLPDDTSLRSPLQTTTTARNSRDAVLGDDDCSEESLSFFANDQLTAAGTSSQLVSPGEKKRSRDSISTITSLPRIRNTTNHGTTLQHEDLSILSAESQNKLKLLGLLEATNDDDSQQAEQQRFSLRYIMIGFHMRSSSGCSAPLRDVLRSFLEAPNDQI